MNRPVHDGILVIDYGSQYTLLITRRLREIGIYAEVVGHHLEKPPEGFEPRGFVLSGGPASVTDKSHTIPKWVLDSKRPVLGICFGMQLLAEALGGKVRAGVRREYGSTRLKWANAETSFLQDINKESTVWMSHGDDVLLDGSPLLPLATTGDGVIAAMYHPEAPVFGLQFHPEVQHTEQGTTFLKNFAFGVCEGKPNWQPKDYILAAEELVSERTGDGHVLMAVSGGVDSTVASVLLNKVLGPKRFVPVFVDNGLLRQNEKSWVKDNFSRLGIGQLEILDAREQFLGALKGITDPEEKRKRIGRTFIEVFESFAKNKPFTHLCQGTLYPDVIESAGEGAGSHVIKTHHNVGGLPERLHLKLVEPFRHLFKDEVRRLGASLGVNYDFLRRHPFPGPGLAVRVLGEVTPERLDLLRQADVIFDKALHDSGLYDEVWQAFVVLLPVKSVGVMGDQRTYESVCALRAVTASDGMTAGVATLPWDFLQKVADDIVRQVRGINRVVYDLTSKPPGTIEWE